MARADDLAVRVERVQAVAQARAREAVELLLRRLVDDLDVDIPGLVVHFERARADAAKVFCGIAGHDGGGSGAVCSFCFVGVM